MSEESNEFFHRSNAAAIESASLALKTLIALNGGAILSLLTFIGSNPDKHRHIASALMYFASGIIAAAISVLSAYPANYFTTEAIKDGKFLIHRAIALGGAVLCAILSLGLFSYGVYNVASALTAEAPASIIKMYIGPVRLELTRARACE